MRSVVAVFAALVGPGLAFAADTKTAGDNAPAISLIDAFVDRAELAGKVVRVTGGYMQHADTLSIIYSAGSGPSVSLDPASMEKEALRTALRECTGREQKPICVGDVIGTLKTDGAFVTLTRAVFVGAPKPRSELLERLQSAGPPKP